MLQMAKTNLASMDHFSLYEYPVSSDYLLTWTFGVKLRKYIVDRFGNGSYLWVPRANAFLASHEGDLDAVYINTDMDIHLYAFAKQLFFRRLKYVLLYDLKHKIKIPTKTQELLSEEISTLSQPMYRLDAKQRYIASKSGWYNVETGMFEYSPPNDPWI